MEKSIPRKFKISTHMVFRDFQLLSFLTTLPQTLPSMGSTSSGIDIPGAQSTKSGSWGSHFPSTSLPKLRNGFRRWVLDAISSAPRPCM